MLYWAYWKEVDGHWTLLHRVPVLTPLLCNATRPVYSMSSAWRPSFWVEICTKIGLFSSKLSFIDIIRVLLNCHDDYGHFDIIPKYICFLIVFVYKGNSFIYYFSIIYRCLLLFIFSKMNFGYKFYPNPPISYNSNIPSFLNESLKTTRKSKLKSL